MLEDQYHYKIIGRALSFIEEHRSEHLGLAEIAEAVGLSPSHFQRVFSEWAGVSPKRFQQYLDLMMAKNLLRDHASLEQVSHEIGLSSTSRLHDLFLTWEAMSPGEYAKKGAGLQIRYSFASSPFGRLLLTATDRGVCGLGFSDLCGDDAALEDLLSRWPNANFTRDEQLAPSIVARIEREQPVHLHLIGSPLQLKVWEALLQIPSGQVSTYSAIADAAGNPKAVRAVGTAIGRNPISWLVPCHRALRKSGGLGGYHWGLPVKEGLLLREAVRLVG